LDLEKHDLAKDPPSRELLERLIGDDDPMTFLNPRSPAYKDRDLGSKKLSKSQVIALMLDDPNLIRRPIVLRGPRRAIFGYDTDQYDELA
jgi:arsenate reductase